MRIIKIFGAYGRRGTTEPCPAAGGFGGKLRIHIMELSGFHVFHKRTPESYLAFLKENGFAIRKSEVFGGSLTLTYAEAKKNNRSEELL